MLKLGSGVSKDLLKYLLRKSTIDISGFGKEFRNGIRKQKYQTYESGLLLIDEWGKKSS